MKTDPAIYVVKKSFHLVDVIYDEHFFFRA